MVDQVVRLSLCLEDMSLFKIIQLQRIPIAMQVIYVVFSICRRASIFYFG